MVKFLALSRYCYLPASLYSGVPHGEVLGLMFLFFHICDSHAVAYPAFADDL